jgi:hypothetical protein
MLQTNKQTNKKLDNQKEKSASNYVSIPPQTFITCPVIYEDKSEAKNNVVFAISSTLPPLFIGI